MRYSSGNIEIIWLILKERSRKLKWIVFCEILSFLFNLLQNPNDVKKIV